MKILPVLPRRLFPLHLTASATRRYAVCAVAALIFGTPAFADNMSDVNGLIHSGQFAEALTKVDASLVQSPRDKQLRFIKGVILTELNKPNEAIAVFTKLTEDYPDLPEPYNNLAVLFAASSQYDKARTALEMAIRTNPTYATAHENLGDVYAKLASQAYDKALQLDSGNTTAKSKLTMIRTLVGNAGSADAKAQSAAAIAAKAAPPTTAAAAAKMAAPKSAPTKIDLAKVTPKAMPKVEPRTEPKTEPRAEPRQEDKVVARSVVANTESDEVLNTVNGWAKAWSAKDVAGYLGYYVSDYQPTNNQPHKAWADDRRVRIEDKGHISVKLDAPKVTVDGNTATVKFRQQYVSNQLRSNGSKTLVLVKQAGKWQIKQERAGS